jgi:hypothetical protein
MTDIGTSAGRSAGFVGQRLPHCSWASKMPSMGPRRKHGTPGFPDPTRAGRATLYLRLASNGASTR